MGQHPRCHKLQWLKHYAHLLIPIGHANPGKRRGTVLAGYLHLSRRLDQYLRQIFYLPGKITVARESCMLMLAAMAITVLLAFVFTFTNGFQDAATVAATFIASRSATPKAGILWVAAMVVLGAILGGSAVALTLAGLVNPGEGGRTVAVLFAALVAAIFWNVLTWKYALPSSSTHAIIGGLVGAALAAAGPGSVFWGWEELVTPPHALVGLAKMLTFLVVSVLIGFLGSYCMRKGTGFLLRNAQRSVNRRIVQANWLVTAAMAFSNGANDTQKQLGIIALVLAAGGGGLVEVPIWARFACAILIGAGTIGGGWRIMHTVGHRIFRIEPIHSFDSQFFSGASIAISTLVGAPVSSTHIISISVLGVGAAENPKKVAWSVGWNIVIAMLMTIPVTMGIGAAIYFATALVTGV
jgi:PiT family inorganic phosphate transporter